MGALAQHGQSTLYEEPEYGRPALELRAPIQVGGLRARVWVVKRGSTRFYVMGATYGVRELLGHHGLVWDGTTRGWWTEDGSTAYGLVEALNPKAKPAAKAKRGKPGQRRLKVLSPLDQLRARYPTLDLRCGLCGQYRQDGSSDGAGSCGKTDLVAFEFGLCLDFSPRR